MTTLFVILIVFGSIGAFFGFNNLLWRFALKYNFSSARNEFWEYHFLGLIYTLVSIAEYSLYPGQRTIDKYDPYIQARKEHEKKEALAKERRAALERDTEYKRHITDLEIDAGLEPTYPEFVKNKKITGAPKEYMR